MPTGELLPPESCKVYTPRRVADAIVRALRPDRDGIWLEPSVGNGVFLLALASVGIPRANIVAVDLDPVDCESDGLALTSRGVDFLIWSGTAGRRFDRIVGNPPYVPLSRLDPRIREAAGAVRIPGTVSTVPSSANIWFAFLCRCLELLQPGGSLGLVLPAAWDFADYAGGLRRYIPTLFEEFTTFRSRRPLFEKVQDGSVVLIGRGYLVAHRRSQRVECADRRDLVANINSVCSARGSSTSAAIVGKNRFGIGATLGQFVEIRLGGVTGHVEFFLLTEEQRRALDLPPRSVTPVISRSRHLTGAAIDKRSWLELLRRGERVWLFNPPDDLTSHPSVSRYLDTALEDGGCDRSRYKVRSRAPWFRTPLPPRIDGFMSGMTRNGPWLALRSMRNLNATNTLYVVRFKEKTSFAAKSAVALAMLTSVVREELRSGCRHYADGLMKHEPGDLLSIKLPPILPIHDAPAACRRAVKYLLAGKDREAQRLADSFFLSQRNPRSLRKS